MAGMDVLVLNERVDQISFGTASHFANMGSWKAGSPTSSPLLLKAQSRQLFIGLQQSHGTTESTINALQQILEATTPWPNPLLISIRQVSHATATKGWAWCNHNAELLERAAELRKLLLEGSGCLEFPKGMAGMDSWKQTCPTSILAAVCHILGTSAAERLAAPLPTHCC